MNDEPSGGTPSTPLRPKSGATKITVDLAKVLTPRELAKFTAAAKAAGSSSLKEHFLNIAFGTHVLGLLKHREMENHRIRTSLRSTAGGCQPNGNNTHTS